MWPIRCSATKKVSDATLDYSLKAELCNIYNIQLKIMPSFNSQIKHPRPLSNSHYVQPPNITRSTTLISWTQLDYQRLLFPQQLLHRKQLLLQRLVMILQIFYPHRILFHILLKHLLVFHLLLSRKLSILPVLTQLLALPCHRLPQRLVLSLHLLQFQLQTLMFYRRKLTKRLLSGTLKFRSRCSVGLISRGNVISFNQSIHQSIRRTTPHSKFR
mgnify:CR=1 FL=1